MYSRSIAFIVSATRSLGSALRRIRRRTLLLRGCGASAAWAGGLRCLRWGGRSGSQWGVEARTHPLYRGGHLRCWRL